MIVQAQWCHYLVSHEVVSVLQLTAKNINVIMFKTLHLFKIQLHYNQSDQSIYFGDKASFRLQLKLIAKIRYFISDHVIKLKNLHNNVFNWEAINTKLRVTSNRQTLMVQFTYPQLLCCFRNCPYSWMYLASQGISTPLKPPAMLIPSNIFTFPVT